MGDWTFGDLLKIAVLLGLGWFSVQSEIEADYRPDYIKYVDDPRNGCVVRNEISLANHQVHIKKAEYRPKILRIYDCANNQIAANITEE